MSIKPPSFIIIPYQLLADPRVKPLEEKLYGFIYWFTKLKNERCTASNKALAELLKTTPGVVQNSLTNLEKRGYIQRTFKDRNKKTRDEIIPLIDFAGVVPPIEEVKRPKETAVVVADPEPPKDPMGGQVNQLIELFEPVNPSFERLFSNKTQRAALERMIKKNGFEKMAGAIKFAGSIVNKPHAPVITTPLQFETKLGQLIAYHKRETAAGPKMVEI